MPFQIDWEYDDESGANPSGRTGLLTFDLEFEFDPGEPAVFYTKDGDGNPSCEPEITFTNTSCTLVDFNDEGEKQRIPTTEEKNILDPWFLDELDRDDKLRQRIEENCIDLVNFEPECDDLDD